MNFGLKIGLRCSLKNVKIYHDDETNQKERQEAESGANNLIGKQSFG